MKVVITFLWSLVATCAFAEEQKVAYSARELALSVSSIKMSLDLFNGEKFCVPKSTSSLVEPRRFSLSGGSLLTVSMALSSRFPCSGISFESEEFTPKEILDRLQTHPSEVIDKLAIDLPEFRMAYDINFISQFSEYIQRCPRKTKMDSEKMSELRRAVEVNGYMGNMNSRVVVALMKQAALCEQ